VATRELVLESNEPPVADQQETATGQISSAISHSNNLSQIMQYNIDLGHGDLGQGRVGDAAGAVGEGRAGGEVQTLGFVIFCRASRMDRHGRRGVRIQSISSQTSPTARALALQHAKTADFQQPQRGIRSRPALTRCRRQTSRSPGRRTGVGVGAGLGRVGKQVAAAGGPVSGDGEETDPS